MMTTQTTRKGLTDYFIRLSYDVPGNILPLDDALQDWTKRHPEQRKLAEALRIHYLLYVYTTGWKTSPENNDVRREVRQLRRWHAASKTTPPRRKSKNHR